VPLGCWPIVITSRDLPGSAGGYHIDPEGQPFALVRFTANWSLTASHECLEMLADPFGDRVVPGFSLREDQGRVSYLVEVCDPCESASFAYTSNGTWVSDFYTPNFFDPEAAPGVRYDFTGNIEKPRQVLKGGYISWHEHRTDEWWQQQFFDGEPEFVNLGVLRNVRNLREAIDAKVKPRPEALGLPDDDPSLKKAQKAWNQVEESSNARARMLRNTIREIKSGKRQ